MKKRERKEGRYETASGTADRRNGRLKVRLCRRTRGTLRGYPWPSVTTRSTILGPSSLLGKGALGLSHG